MADVLVTVGRTEAFRVLLPRFVVPGFPWRCFGLAALAAGAPRLVYWPLLRSWALRRFPLRNGLSFRFVRCGATQSERGNQELPLEVVALKTLVPQLLSGGSASS